MTKVKKLILIFATLALVLTIPNVASAADYADTPDDAESVVEYTRTIPSNEGTIKLNFTGLELDVMQAYEFALVRQGGTPESWFTIDDGYTETTATITLSSATSKIVEVLKATDTGFIYIREKDDTTGTYVLEAYKVDLKLPYLQSLAYTKEERCFNVAYKIYGSIGDQYSNIGSSTTYVKWEKVTDRNLIENYLYIKNNNGNITDLESSLPNPPTTGYSLSKEPEYTDKNDGLYLLWVKRTGENCKDVYSCIVHDGLEEATTVEQYVQNLDVEAPTMESLEIQWSTSFEPDSTTRYYFVTPGTSISIKATFSEVIYGDTAPILTIKCGNGEGIELSNGVITGSYIVYTYTISEQDVGIISAVEMSGGDVADEYGNLVTEYTYPTLGDSIEGRFVYANGSGIVSSNGTNTGNDTKTDSGTGSETNQTTDNKKDDTIANVVYANAGAGIGTIVALIIVIVAGIVVYSKYNKMRDI